MSTPKKTVEQRLEAKLHQRERQIQDLKGSRDYWMKRALKAERKGTA